MVKLGWCSIHKQANNNAFFKQCILSLFTPTCYNVVVWCAIDSIDILKEAYHCAFFLVAAKLVPKETLQSVWSYLTATSLLHGIMCITRHQHLQPISISLDGRLLTWNLSVKHLFSFHIAPLFSGIFFYFFLFFLSIAIGDLFVLLPQGMYIIRFTIHVHLFLLLLYNHTHILGKSIYKEKCRRLECFHFFLPKQNLLGVSLQCNKSMCYHPSILVFLNHHNQGLFTQTIHLTVSLHHWA